MSCYHSFRNRKRGVVEINMAPLIDMIFILLIFFMVTTSFVREAGVDVERPVAATATSSRETSLLIGVTGDGRVAIEGKTVDVRQVRAYVNRFLASSPDGAVLVVADRSSRTGDAVLVLDQCRLAGANKVGLAARHPEE